MKSYENNVTPLVPKIKVITLDNPYTCFEDKRTMELLSKLIPLKAKGYAPPNYPASYLALDSADFIGRHHIFLMKTGEAWEPVSGFKHITLERCDYYGMRPPYLGLLDTHDGERHRAVMSELFERHRRKSLPLIFSSGFTLRDDLRGGPVSQIIKELVAALMYSDSVLHNHAPLIGIGVPRFKTERLWEKTGYRAVEDKQGVLPPFSLKTSNNEPLVLMKAESFSDWAKQCHERHIDMIESRETISARTEATQERSAKAA